MMNAVQAIEDANKEIHHGELTDVLPVGSLGNSDQPPPLPPLPALQIPHPLHQQHQHHHHHHHHQQQQQQQQHHQQQLQTSQSSHHHQQHSSQANHSQSVGSQPQHEPISPHHSQPQSSSQQQQLQQQSVQTQHSLDLDHQHPMPSQSVPPSSTSTSTLQLHSQGVNTLEIGVDIASSSQRAHLCNTCSKGFRSKQQLAQHSLVHTNIRKYTCSYCERAFKQLSHLQQHTRIHTDKGETDKVEDRRYLCQFCERAFKQLAHLQQHTRLHTGEKPYSCKFEDCDRAFAQLSNLQHHMRNHEDQVKKEASRIHKCLICHRSYTNESSLKAHTLKMHIHIKQVPLEGQNPDGQPVKKRRKKKSKQLYNAPTMVPLAVHSDGDGQSLGKKSLSETSSDDDLIISGEKRQQDFPAGLGGIPRSLVESLNHYERTLAAGMSGKKLQDGNISSSNQISSQSLGASGSGFRGIDHGRAASLGLQSLMGLPGIDHALMSAQPPEVIERAAAAAAAAVSSQLLQNSHGLSHHSNNSSNLSEHQPNPQPAHSQSQIGTKSNGGTGGSNNNNNTSGRTSVSTPQPHLQPLSPLDMMGMSGAQYPTHKPYSQIMDAHLRSQVTPMSLPTVHEQYYAHPGPPLGMLSHHARFLGPPRGMTELPMSYGSHISSAASTVTTSQLSLSSGPHGNSRPPSDIGSPQHVSEALNFNT